MKLDFQKENIIPLFLMFLFFGVLVFFIKRYILPPQQIFLSFLALGFILIIPREIPKSKEVK